METKILNTVGMAHHLGISETRVHKLVSTGRLTAHMYSEQGQLVPKQSLDSRQGQGLYFTEEDIAAYKPRKAGRPPGAKDKKPRVFKTHQKMAQNA